MSNKKILIVDDSKLNRNILVDILSNENNILYTCSNGAEAIEIANEVIPDVILLDIIMPEVDGFQVCRVLKDKEETRDIAIIMVTAETKSQNIKKALELGAFDYIRKPLDEVEVSARVNSALKFKDYQDKLKDLAMKDGLTDIYNHRRLIEVFEMVYSKHLDDEKGICFAMLDVDYFKRVNDNFGHTFGDMVLKVVAAIIKKSVRECDTVGRYGGEEFAIVFPSIDINEAEKLCENVRKNIEKYEFNFIDKVIKITISIGAYFKSTKNNVCNNDMIVYADRALYRAKDNGRNRVEIES